MQYIFPMFLFFLFGEIVQITFDDNSPTVVAAVTNAMKALIFKRMIKTKTTAIAITRTRRG